MFKRMNVPRNINKREYKNTHKTFSTKNAMENFYALKLIQQQQYLFMGKMIYFLNVKYLHTLFLSISESQFQCDILFPTLSGPILYDLLIKICKIIQHFRTYRV